MEENNNIFEKVAGILNSYKNSGLENNEISNKYFIMSNSTETKVIGNKFPQTEYIDLKIAHSLSFHSLPNQNVTFDKIEIYKSSKLTDLISTMAFSAHAFILSEKATEIFKTFNLGEHRIYKAFVYHKGNKYNYFVLHFLNDLKNELDYHNSTFQISDILGRHICDLEIKDKEDYESKKELIKSGDYPEVEKWSSIKLKKGIFKDTNNINDIFTLECSSIDKFISSGLKQAIIDNNLTGFQIAEVRNIHD